MPTLFHRAGTPDPKPPNLWAEALGRLPPEDQAILPLGDAKLKVLDELVSTVEERKKQHDARKICVIIAGHDFKLQETADRVVGWIDKFKTIVDGLIGIDPIHIGIPWACFKTLLLLSVNHAETTASLLAGIDKMSRQIASCHVYEQLYLHDHTSKGEFPQTATRLRTELTELYTSMLAFLVRCMKYLREGRSVFERTAGTFRSGAISELLKNCNDGIGYVEVAINDCARSQSAEARAIIRKQLEKSLVMLEQLCEPIQKIDRWVQYITEVVDSNKRLAVLQWISKTPYAGFHQAASEGRTPGTCTWLIRHPSYMEWLQSIKAALFWLHGYPGFGKTKLISAAVDDLKQIESRNPNIAVAYFYCDQHRDERKQPKNIISSFIRQLATERNTQLLPKYITSLYEQKNNSSFAESLSLSEQSEVLIQLLQHNPLTYLVIDALDECDPASRASIISILKTFIERSKCTVKVLISSRPEQDIAAFFRKDRDVAVRAVDNRSDIDLFVRARLQERPITWRKWFDNNLHAKILQVLVQGGEGMFQWVTLQLKYLFELNRKSDVEKRLLQLHNLPKELKAAYHEIHARIQKQHGSAAQIAYRALRWIMVSVHPVTPCLLVGAASQDSSIPTAEPIDIDISYILQACQNLVSVVSVGANEECRFSHLSVKEYLEEELQFTRPAHAYVADVALAKLQSKHLTEARLNDSSPLQEFAWYVTYYWPHHMKYGYGGTQDKNLLRRLEAFLGCPSASSAAYRHWAENLDSCEPIFTDFIKGSGFCQMYLEPYSNPIFAIVGLDFDGFGVSWWRANGIDPNQCNSFKDNLLSLAARSNASYSAEILLRLKADINALNNIDTPLMSAARGKHVDMMKLLLSRGADPHIVTPRMGNLLHAACITGKLEIVKIALGLRVNVNVHAGPVGGSLSMGNPLQVACRSHSSQAGEIVRLLLDCGAEWNVPPTSEGSPLELAERTGHKDIVLMLVRLGADAKQIRCPALIPGLEEALQGR